MKITEFDRRRGVRELIFCRMHFRTNQKGIGSNELKGGAFAQLHTGAPGAENRYILAGEGGGRMGRTQPGQGKYRKKSDSSRNVNSEGDEMFQSTQAQMVLSI